MYDLEALEQLGCEVFVLHKNGWWYTTVCACNINSHTNTGKSVSTTTMEKTRAESIDSALSYIKRAVFKTVCFIEIEENNSGVN